MPLFTRILRRPGKQHLTELLDGSFFGGVGGEHKFTEGGSFFIILVALAVI